MDLSIISSITSIISSLLGITAIVVFHEFGHYVFCKIFNVYTPTFSIGMGNVLASKKIGHTNFCLSVAPIGGYVEIATDKGIPGTKGFNELYYYQKFLIMLGGIFCNFLLTYMIFVGLLFTGMPESGLPYQTNTTSIELINEKSINHNQLQKNDVITAINNKPTDNNASIISQEVIKLRNANEKQIHATVLRNKEPKKVLLNIKAEENALSKILDVTFRKKPTLSFTESCKEAYKLTKFCLFSIVNALKQIFSANTSKSLVGPIMTIALSSKSAQKGFDYFLLLLAIISINLGFMNLLPLPIFDGGQFVFFTIEAITGRSLSERVQHIIGITSWGLALGLMIIFSLKDIYHLTESYIAKL